MNMMRHCRQCRADAVGLLGEDRSAEFTTEKIMEMEVSYDIELRQAYQNAVEQERLAKVAAKNAELETLAREEASDVKILDRRRHQGRRPRQRALWPRQGVPGLRAQHLGREIRRSPPRRSLLPGRLRRGGQSRDRHQGDQRLHRGVRRQDRTLPEGQPDRRRHRSGRSIRLRVHRAIRHRLFQGLSRRVKRGEIAHVARGDADIRQGAYISA